MSVEVQWMDDDPQTGARRFVQAERWARGWTFRVRGKRRENWSALPTPGVEIWEALLAALERRLSRREGVTDDDIRFVRKQLAEAQLQQQRREDQTPRDRGNLDSE
jgi:hypothetical protein